MYTEIDTRLGVMGYSIKDDLATLEMYRGRDAGLTVPDHIEVAGRNIPVIAISRKTFLSDKYLHSVSVPDSVREIGDWCFAGCVNLETIMLSEDIELGNGVFKDCRSIKEVIVLPRGERDRDASYLLAAVMSLLEDKYLFDLKASGTQEWYRNLDLRINMVLNEADEEGFTQLLACGEEDYEGRDNTLDAYLSRRRRRKARICLLRLLHDTDLTPEDRNRLRSYIYEHRAGSASPAAWEVVLKSYPDDEAYFNLLCSEGMVDRTNIDIMLNDLGEAHPGMKSLLIRFTGSIQEDAFSLTL